MIDEIPFQNGGSLVTLNTLTSTGNVSTLADVNFMAQHQTFLTAATPDNTRRT
jgi:hypothetical protein